MDKMNFGTSFFMQQSSARTTDSKSGEDLEENIS